MYACLRDDPDDVFHCSSLRLGSEARIQGNLRYLSNFEAELAEGALVLGTLERVTPPLVVKVEIEDETATFCDMPPSIQPMLLDVIKPEFITKVTMERRSKGI